MKPELVQAVESLEKRVREAVDARRAVDPEPGDGFLGLHLSDERVEALLARRSDEAPVSATWMRTLGAPPGRLTMLAKTCGLDHLDVALLAVVLAPDVDRRFEWLYGYLQDDITRRRASVGLALELCDQLPHDARSRARLGPSGRLARVGLIEILEPDRPQLTRGLRSPDRVIDHLLGGSARDVRLESWVAATSDERVIESEMAVAIPPADAARLVYLQTSGGAGLDEAVAAVVAGGREALRCDVRRLDDHHDVRGIAEALVLEAHISDATLVVGPIDAFEVAPLVKALASTNRHLVFTGARAWDQCWSHRPPHVIEVDVALAGGSPQVWRSRFGSQFDYRNVDQGVAAFRLDAERTDRAAATALVAAAADGTGVTHAHVSAGVRAQNTPRLEELARRTEPSARWVDLVLPDEQLDQLQELVARARLSPLVLDEWGMRRGGGRGEGVAVLFAGESGTGKTMSAEVLAGELGQDLYRIDLSTVVDKYIGETEKNLERVFTEAEHSNGVLFFDEADALFGKRTEVSDAHDRHANVEVAYLLQRMEDFSGVAILATNLRANLDDAFTRRLTSLLDFPMPDEAARRRLWEQCLGDSAPRSLDLDLDFCAQRFELSGGSIRNITLAAAFLAAKLDQAIGMVHIIQATRREYQKMGRLITDREFGAWAQ